MLSLKQLCLRLLPESIYKPMARREVHPRRLWHKLRWHVAGRTHIERWVERRLQFKDEYWLFLLGLNNSGTTLLNRILASHPGIRALPREGQLLSIPVPRAAEHGVIRTWSTRPDIFRWTADSHPEVALRVKYDWAYFAEPRPGIVLEKSPMHSAQALWLQRHFQPCRFLVIVRHPYGVCEGIIRRGKGTAREAAEHWVRGNQYLLEDMPKLAYVHQFKYEDLCDHPDETLAGIETFLGLEQPLDRAILEEPIRAPNMDKAPAALSNFNARSLERLGPEDLATINSIAGPMMDHFGYAQARHAEEAALLSV